jgi:hypothetical protein
MFLWPQAWRVVLEHRFASPRPRLTADRFNPPGWGLCPSSRNAAQPWMLGAHNHPRCGLLASLCTTPTLWCGAPIPLEPPPRPPAHPPGAATALPPTCTAAAMWRFPAAAPPKWPRQMHSRMLETMHQACSAPLQGCGAWRTSSPVPTPPICSSHPPALARNHHIPGGIPTCKGPARRDRMVPGSALLHRPRRGCGLVAAVTAARPPPGTSAAPTPCGTQLG